MKMVRKAAIGSLLPDSYSSSGWSLPRKLTLRAPQNREHGGRVGRRDDRAEQQAPLEGGLFRETEVFRKVQEPCREESEREQPDEKRGQQHAEARQHAAVTDHAFDRLPGGVVTAGVEDERHGDAADDIGGGRVVEGDDPEEIGSRQHADAEKDEEHGDVEAAGNLARTGAGQDQHGKHGQVAGKVGHNIIHRLSAPICGYGNIAGIENLITLLPGRAIFKMIFRQKRRFLRGGAGCPENRTAGERNAPPARLLRGKSGEGEHPFDGLDGGSHDFGRKLDLRAPWFLPGSRGRFRG